LEFDSGQIMGIRVMRFLSEKTHIILAITLLVSSLITVSCGNPYTYNIKDDGFAVITAPLSLNKEANTTHIPQGSVIHHWANGITEVYGPDNNRLFIAKDSESTGIGAPGGFKPATHVYHVPDGSRISTDDNITRIYLDDDLILTVIEESKDFLIHPSP